MKVSRDDLETMLGEPKHAIRSLALALSLSYLVVHLNSFIDSYWVTNIGDAAMSAVSSMYPIYFIITSVGVGLGVGVSSTISFRLGKGDIKRTSLLASNALITGTLLSVIVSVVVFLLLDPVVSFMGVGDIRSECIDYSVPLTIMASALILNGVVAGLLRSEGSRRRSVILLILSSGANMLLDPVLIFTMGMDVAGAGWATGISALLATVVGLYWYATGKMAVKIPRSSLRFDVSASRELLGVGAPRTVEALITGITNVIQRVFIVAAGASAAVMLYNLPFRYVILVIVIAEAIGAALIPVCSAAIGQCDEDKMRAGMSYSLKLMLILSTSVAVLLFVFAEPLAGVFINDPSMEQYRDLLTWVLRMFCLLVPFDGMRKLGSCMLQVVRRSKLSTAAMLLWAMIKLVLYWIASTISFEALIYAAVVSYMIGGLLMMYLSYRNTRTVRIGHSES